MWDKIQISNPRLLSGNDSEVPTSSPNRAEVHDQACGQVFHGGELVEKYKLGGENFAC